MGSRAEENTTIGHNSLTQAAREKLRQMVAKIEKLEEERKEVGVEIRETYAEAASLGYDRKAMRKVIQDRKKDRDALTEFEQIVDLYKLALGDI